MSEYRATSENSRIEKGKIYLDVSSRSLAFLHDNQHLVSGTKSGFLRLHKVPDLNVETTIKAHDNDINGMDALSCGKSTFLLSCSKDNWIKVVRVRPQSLTIIAQYNAVESLCITGFINQDDILNIYVGDTWGLLSVLRIDLNSST